jgi:hypothetical protein
MTHCLPRAFVPCPLLSALACHCRPPLVCCRRPPLLSTTTAIIVTTQLSPPTITTTPTASCHHLLSAATILAISGPPLLSLFLVCGRHPCHLLSTIPAPLIAAAGPCLKQSLVASTITSHPPVPPTLSCSRHHLLLFSSISFCLPSLIRGRAL